jgi:putative inorganic carbon (hco3(-)) transporter
MTQPLTAHRAAMFLAVLAPTAMFASPAAFSILLGAALLTLIWARIPLRLPAPTWVPLLLFLIGTLVAVALSPDPVACWPQVKKFWVFLVLPLFYSAVRHMSDLRRVGLLWTALASMTAAWSFEQFVRKWEMARAAHTDFYLAYLGSRVTGLRDHWMTFAGEQMIVAMVAASLLLFAPRFRRGWWLAVALALISASLVISLTRGVWAATVVGLLYLVGMWRARYLPLVPVLLLIVAWAGPSAVRERITSLYQPKEADSNMQRVYVWRTGVAMVEAHPWFGLGPDQVKVKFDDYIPPDLSKQKPVGFYGHLHNIYLQYAAERGVPTLIALLWFVLGNVVVFAGKLRQLPPGRCNARFALHGAIAVTLAILIEGFVETNLADSEVLAMYLATMAMAYVAADAAPQRPETAAE